MKICLIHQYFKTPETGGAIRSYYIANYLKSKGHTVTVITARNNRAYSVDKSLGYDVHYLPVYYENHLSFLSRIHAFFIFVWKANRLIKKLQPFDLNYVITTPLTTGFIATRALKRFGTPYIFEVGDLWPEAPIQLGVINNPLLKWITRNWEMSFYSKAKSIVALSPDIKDYIQSKCPNCTIEVITNFADIDLFKNAEVNESLSHLENKFVISYLGTVGLANQLEYLISFAEKLTSENVHIVVAGGGAQFNKIKIIAINKGLKNITFLDQTDKKGVASILSITDAIYISFKNVPVLGTGSPNKFFDGLASGKMIVINFQGWLKSLVEKHDVGVYYHPEKPEELVEKLTPYFEQSRLIKVKENSLALAEKFTPKNQLSRLDTILKF
ncbi:glycosyltransferase family 4 protein [Fulvivirga lutea]|uniref:Glycosyltransferase family 4 protein n=1 Tax=Fulvivirga lutea TaxID=2810512 RepID=A0A974WMJ8_9BACT|nr:glycosyltransferase family 4 protein [Fulvivirga lutea]QSE98193.1 glycosyltransferase family 4 protein [Fulvivirga lutea]